MKSLLKLVLDKDRWFYAFLALSMVRRKMLLNSKTIQVEDLGAGSKRSKGSSRTIKSIANTSVKKEKFAQLLFRLIESQPSGLTIELGTSLGLTTGYLSKANKEGKIITIEGSEEIAKVAKANFDLMKLKNVDLKMGNFDEELPKILKEVNHIDYVFVDGNHKKEPTLRYFDWVLPKLTEKSIVIFDDIYWSKEMAEAWAEIKENKKVIATVDVFEMGIAFFDPAYEAKHYNFMY